jgi:hypothetical protein
MADLSLSLKFKPPPEVEFGRARALLAQPETRERVWPLLAAAGLVAFSALGLAAAVILGPPKPAPANLTPELRLKPAVSTAGRPASVEPPGLLGRPPERAGLM